MSNQIHKRHIELIELVNDSQTRSEHEEAEARLSGFRDALRHIDYTLIDCRGCDNHYLKQGVDRPMCCGVWLDWEPTYEEDEGEDICGFCGKPGADKIPHPVRWKGEQKPGTDFVHAECEAAECERAFASLTQKEVDEDIAALQRAIS